MDRPLILITTWRRALPTYLGERTMLETLDPAYAERVTAAGGRLTQRAPSRGVHTELDGLPAGRILAARHPVALVPGSRVRRALRDRDRVSVNTIHHHQIEDPGELAVTATAPDGTIEAVEPVDNWPCVGVQWHPEKMAEPEQRGLFEQLTAAANAEALGGVARLKSSLPGRAA